MAPAPFRGRSRPRSRSRTDQRRLRRVALIIETTRSYTRDLLAGVRRYQAEHGTWSTFLELRGPDSAPPPWLVGWNGDGILCRTFTQELADQIAATGLPAVELRSSVFNRQLPVIGMDNQLIGRLVAEHLLERGYRCFATYRLSSERFFVERMQSFTAVITAAGGTCSESPEEASDQASDWEHQQQRLIAWLQGLPKPIAIFAANDQLGVRLLDACQRAGIAVPQAVAVVGAENEEALCNSATPPLSSVQFDGFEVGYRAARLLDELMRGKKPAQRVTLVPPKGLIVRASSDDLVIADELVVRAARLIRDQATGGIAVKDLCRLLAVSRSTLERRMTAALRVTPKDEIQRIRFREAERLLRDTELTIEAIAQQTGFTASRYLQAAFKQRHGQTPGAFRQSHRR